MTDHYQDDELNIDPETAHDDVSFEETDAEGVAVSQADKLKKLRADLAAAKKESMENLTGWQKERADFINFKKGEFDRIAAGKERAVEGVLMDVIAVADSFDMAMGNSEAWDKVDANWRMGVEYIYQQLKKVLEENGVTEIAVTVGDTFNHELHEPVETVATDDASQDDMIAKVIQKGYKKGEKVLRPAKVNVFNK